MGVAAVALLCALLVWREALLRRARAGLRAGEEERARSVRLVRLAAGEMRSVGLSLLGHAAGGGTGEIATAPEFLGTARRLIDTSEGVLEQTEAPGAPRRLEESRFPLLPVVEFAVAQVAAQLGASPRAWRIGEEFATASLFADQRAINQVLVSVLTNAAACTRGGDWIEISAAPAEAGWVVTVQDEGIGLPIVGGDGEGHETRGLGIGLTLARGLMAAHGGTLTVETAARVGSRVRLGFPAARVKEGLLF